MPLIGGCCARVSAIMKGPPPVASTCGPAAQQAGDHLALAFAEIGFAVVLEDVLDRLAGRLLDLLVGIDEGQLEPGGEPAPDGGLAAARHADQHERAAAEVRADGEHASACGLLGFASYAESDHLFLMPSGAAATTAWHLQTQVFLMPARPWRSGSIGRPPGPAVATET